MNEKINIDTTYLMIDLYPYFIKNLQEFAGVCVAVGIGIQFFG